MIYLITGANGAGKSLFAVSLIDKIVSDNMRPDALTYSDWILQFEEDELGYLNPIVDNPKPLIRSVFSNIPGLDFKSEYVYTLPDGLYDLQDRSKFPFGSVIFDDECHRRIPGTGKSGPYGDPRVDQLDMHRHQGHDVYYITQYPSKLHHVVRNLVSRHYHLQNAMGSDNATLFTFQHAELNPNDYGARQGADKEVFRYPKRLFSYYKSSSLHTKRLKIPVKIKFLFGLIMIILSLLLYQLSGSFISDAPASDVPVSLPIKERVVERVGASPPATPSRTYIISGCIHKDHNCQCYDSELYPIDLDFASCLNYLESPLPFRPVISASSSSSHNSSD